MTRLPIITTDDQLWLHDNPNTSDIVEWIQDYASRTVELNARTCGTCRHYDPDHGTKDGVRYGFCTNRHGWHAGRSMPPFDGCIAWAASDEEDGA